MSWITEIVAVYSTRTELLDAGEITGDTKLTNGTIAIVTEESSNTYIWNATLSKWKVRSGNMYANVSDLPSAAVYNIDEGTELWDSWYKLKRRWTGAEWELQKDVENITLSGYGVPTSIVGKYGNYYTDLNTGRLYSKTSLERVKVDALGLFDAGTLTVTTDPTYSVLTTARSMFIFKTGHFSTTTTTFRNNNLQKGKSGYILFDFNGSPQQITRINMGFCNASNEEVSSFTWSAANNINGPWEELGAHGGNIDDLFRTLTCTPFETYRFYRCNFIQTGIAAAFSIQDLWFLTDSGDPVWKEAVTPQQKIMHFSQGIPAISVGSKDAVAIDVNTNNVYRKSSLGGCKIPIVNILYSPYSVAETNYIKDGLFTNYVAPLSGRFVFDVGAPAVIDNIIIRRYTTNVLNCYYYFIFGSNDNLSWNYIHQQGWVDGNVYRDITITTTNVANDSYRYFYVDFHCNSKVSEMEFYSNSAIGWELIGNITQINATAFTNQLDTSIINPQLLANYVDTQYPIVNVDNNYAVTAAQFNTKTRFKINNTDPVLVTLPDLTVTQNNKTIEIVKLGKGDIVLNTTSQVMGKPGNSVVINNTGLIGESIIIEFVSEVSMFVIKSNFGSWNIASSLPVYRTLQTITISPDGVTWVFVFSGAIISGADGFSTGISVAMTTSGAHTLTYSSGENSTTLSYISNKYVDSTDTVVTGLNYVQPGQGLEGDDRNSVKSLTNHAVSNTSTLSLPTIASATIQPDGISWVFVFSTAMTYSALPNVFSATMLASGVVTLTYSSGIGTNSITFTGNKTVASADTVVSGLNYSDATQSWKANVTQLVLKAFTNFTITNSSTQ